MTAAWRWVRFNHGVHPIQPDWIDARFLITPLSFSICQPCIVSQHSTVLLTSVIVKLVCSNLASLCVLIPFRGEGWIWNNEVRFSVTRGWIKSAMMCKILPVSLDVAQIKSQCRNIVTSPCWMVWIQIRDALIYRYILRLGTEMPVRWIMIWLIKTIKWGEN